MLQSPVDGKPMLLTPEESIQIQVSKLSFSPCFSFIFTWVLSFCLYLYMLYLKCTGDYRSLHNVICFLNKIFPCFKYNISKLRDGWSFFNIWNLSLIKRSCPLSLLPVPPLLQILMFSTLDSTFSQLVFRKQLQMAIQDSL